MRFFTAQKQFQGVLLAAALICTVAASFLPYSVELPLGIAALLLADHAVCIRDENRPGWVLIAVMVGCALSAGLTIVLLIGHVLGVVAVIEALNLLVIALSCVGAAARKKAAYRVLIVTSALFFAFGAFSHIVYGRSVMATVAEWVLLSQKVSDEEVPAVFQKLEATGEDPLTANLHAFDKRVKESSFDGMRVLTVNADGGYDSVVFYIHGGYYVYQLSNDHIAMMNRIANATNAMLVMPLYPLAPLHDTADSYETMVSLFAQVCSDNEGKKIVLMGDSAGGGYSLALAEGLAAHGVRQPDELILLSPWVDVTMSNPQIADYVDVDPALTVTMGRMSGEAWAGGLPTNDWHVSPIYGDLSALKNVSIFVGTRELFYPDNTLLYEKLRDNENVNLYIGKGLNHVYPAFPIPEGRAGVQQIIRIIQR